MAKPRSAIRFVGDWAFRGSSGLGVNDDALFLIRAATEFPGTNNRSCRWFAAYYTQASSNDSLFIEHQRDGSGNELIVAQMKNGGTVVKASLSTPYRYAGGFHVLVHVSKSSGFVKLYALDGSTDPPQLQTANTSGTLTQVLDGRLTYFTTGGHYTTTGTGQICTGQVGPIMCKVGLSGVTVNDANVLKWLLDPDTFYALGLTHAWGAAEVAAAEVHPKARTQLDDSKTNRWLDTVGSAHMTMTSPGGATTGEPYIYPDYQCGPLVRQAMHNLRIAPAAISDGTNIYLGGAGLAFYDAADPAALDLGSRKYYQKCSLAGAPTSWPIYLPDYWITRVLGTNVDNWNGVNLPNGEHHFGPTLGFVGSDLYYGKSGGSNRTASGSWDADAYECEVPTWVKIDGAAPTQFGDGTSTGDISKGYDPVYLDFDGADTWQDGATSCSTYRASIATSDRMLYMERLCDADNGGLCLSDTEGNSQVVQLPGPQVGTSHNAGHPLRWVEFTPGKYLGLYMTRYDGSVGYNSVTGFVISDPTDISSLTNPNTGAALSLPLAKAGTAEIACRIGTYATNDAYFARAITDGAGTVWIFQLIDSNGIATQHEANVCDIFRVIKGVWNGNHFNWSEHEDWNFPAVATGHAVNSVRTPVFQFCNGVILCAWADELWGANPTTPYTGVGYTGTNTYDDDGVAHWPESWGTAIHIFVCRTPYSDPDNFDLLHSDWVTAAGTYAGTKVKGIQPLEWGDADLDSDLILVQIADESNLKAVVGLRMDAASVEFVKVKGVFPSTASGRYVYGQLVSGNHAAPGSPFQLWLSGTTTPTTIGNSERMVVTSLHASLASGQTASFVDDRDGAGRRLATVTARCPGISRTRLVFSDGALPTLIASTSDTCSAQIEGYIE